MLLILGPVARDIKGAVASAMLGELVAPEIVVWAALVDPVVVHPVQEIILAKWLQECADVWATVWRDRRAAWCVGSGVRTRRGIVLAAQIAVLSEGAIAEVGPETVE